MSSKRKCVSIAIEDTEEIIAGGLHEGLRGRDADATRNFVGLDICSLLARQVLQEPRHEADNDLYWTSRICVPQHCSERLQAEHFQFEDLSARNHQREGYCSAIRGPLEHRSANFYWSRNDAVNFGLCCVGRTRTVLNQLIRSFPSEGLDFVKDLSLQNVRDLIQMIEWNEKHNIRFMRLSSEIFPFAAHEDPKGKEHFRYSLEFAREPLKAVGDLAKQLGHRLTFHPGQYSLLSSVDEGITRRSIADLQMHADIANLMGLEKDSVMIIHGGGTYGNKPSALQRIEKNLLALPKDIKDRLVLEKDEICFSVEDLLPVCERTATPLVLDW